MIVLAPYSKERFVEVYRSMRAPVLHRKRTIGKGTTMLLHTEGGIVLYKLFIKDYADVKWVEGEISK